MKFRNAAPNLAPRVLAGAELLLVNKIAFAAPQLLPTVLVLTATVDLQKKGQVDEYKGESKFLTATNSAFLAIASPAIFCAPRCTLAALRPGTGSLASSPLFPYPTTAQSAEDSAVSSQAGGKLHGN
jgi:hypothetical protein